MSSALYPSALTAAGAILSAGKRALLPKRLTLGTLTALALLSVYLLFHYVTAAIHGEKISALWSAYGFIPPYDYGAHLWSVRLLLGIGYLCMGACLIGGMVAISRIRHLEATGILDTTIREAMRFSSSRMGGLLLVLLGIFGLIAIPLFLILTSGIVNRVPLVGGWGWGLLFMIPSLILALIVAAVLYVVPLAIPTIVPAMLATQEKRDSFAVLVRLFSSVMRQPVRFFGLTALGIALGKVCVFLFAYVLYRGIELLLNLVRVTGGGEVHDRLAGALSYMPLDTRIASFVFSLYPGSRIAFDPSNLADRAAGDPLEIFFAVGWLVVFALIGGYAISFWADIALAITDAVTPAQASPATAIHGRSADSPQGTHEG